MKKSNILDFFQSQSQVVTTSCPACGLLVLKSKLNEHLDALCSSALPSSGISGSRNTSIKPCSSKAKTVNSKANSVRLSSTSNRLSLKTQRKEKNQKTLKRSNRCIKEVIETENDDVVILKEIHSPINKTVDTFNKNASISNADESSKQLKTLTTEHAQNATANNNAISKLSRHIVLKRRIKNRITEDNASKVSKFSSSEEILLPKRRKSSLEKSIPFCESTSSSFMNSKIPHRKNVMESSISCNEVNFKEAKSSWSDLAATETTSQDADKMTSNFSRSLKEIKVVKGSTLSPSNKADWEATEASLSKTNATEIASQDAMKETSKFACSLNEIQVVEGSMVHVNTPARDDSSNRENNSNILSPSSDIANILHIAKEAMDNDSLFSELSGNEEEKPNSQNSKSYTPYYIANFKHILDAVLNEEDNQKLFNKEDLDSIAAFKAQKDAAQMLYVRLFQRKYKWFRVNKINYPEITINPQETLDDLVSASLVDSGTSDIELEKALDLLSLPETKSLAKHFNFNSGKNKSEIKQMVLKHCKEHKSVFFMNASNSIAKTMLKKVKQIMGPCYRISLLPKRLFTRILMLFSLPTISEDDDEAAGGQQQQLLTLLQVNKGELVFPDYKRTKETVIFCDRDELIRYEKARQLEVDIFNAVEKKNFELAKDLYISAKEEFEEQCSCSFADRASSLPAFLKRYTSLHVYVRCMTQGVEILQKLRQYKEAVTLLNRLLKQTVFCQDYSGRWYDRLALNLEQHLKQPEKALEAIKKGLKSTHVRVGHRYSLLTRALRITKSWDESDDFRNQILKEALIKDAPKVVINGRLCPRAILGRRHVFVSSSVATDEDDVTVLGVEQLAIEHYQEKGFSEGIHGEGSTFISLYSLLFWDIIYDGSIPDVFISPHQTHPLDLNYDAFFQNREHQILSHLETLRVSTTEELKEIVKTSWESHHGQSSLVSWDRFRDVEHVQGLVACMGNNILCGICERLAKDFRFTRSGVPDLVVWNPETLCVKIVEVKGPFDKLSSKQILWLDYLLTLGADAEVCLVKAVASKKLRKLES